MSTAWFLRTPEQRARAIQQRRLRRQAAAAARRAAGPPKPRQEPPLSPAFQRSLEQLAREEAEITPLTRAGQGIVDAITAGYRVDREGRLRSPRGRVLRLQPAGNVEVHPWERGRVNVTALRFAAAYWFGRRALYRGNRVLARDGNRNNLRKENIEIVTHAERMRRTFATKRMRQPDAKPVPYAKVDRLTARAIRFHAETRGLRVGDVQRQLANKGIVLSYNRVYKIIKGYNYR